MSQFSFDLWDSMHLNPLANVDKIIRKKLKCTIFNEYSEEQVAKPLTNAQQCHIQSVNISIYIDSLKANV